MPDDTLIWTFDSKCLEEARYQPARNRMFLRFRRGAWYRYEGVPGEVFGGLVKASSAGTYYGSFIRGRYSCFPVGDLVEELDGKVASAVAPVRRTERSSSHGSGVTLESLFALLEAQQSLLQRLSDEVVRLTGELEDTQDALQVARLEADIAKLDAEIAQFRDASDRSGSWTGTPEWATDDERFDGGADEDDGDDGDGGD